MMQVALSMTCPKTPFVTDGVTPGDGFPTGNFGTPDTFVPAEMTNEELDNVRKLIQEFGL